MIIVAILKHVAGKSADYGAALDYLKYEHDEVLKKPLLDANGNWVLRRDILLEGIQIAVTIYTQACPRTSLFCFLLYQLSLWWVKYRAQPEAISTQNHAGRNAP